jgi:hypothetical protein
MTENASEEIAFCFLNDIKKKFIQNYDFDKIASFHAYHLTEFVDVLKQYMVKIYLFN